MKKTTLNAAIAVALGVSALATASVEAAVLSIDQGVKTVTSFTYNGNTYTNTTVSGSWFSMDADNNGTVAIGEITVIGGLNGIAVDGVTTQPATGSHSGAPTGLEGADIDNAWAFFSNTGMHQTTSAVTTLARDDVAGTATLDFSGWSVTWNGIADIPMSSGVSAFMTCSVGGAAAACGDGASYSLEYAAVVPLGDPSGFGGVPYVLHTEGLIAGELPQVVPVPAAVWLFGSGLLGLVGVARRRKV